jgi:hypothetical protein
MLMLPFSRGKLPLAMTLSQFETTKGKHRILEVSPKVCQTVDDST